MDSCTHRETGNTLNSAHLWAADVHIGRGGRADVERLSQKPFFTLSFPATAGNPVIATQKIGCLRRGGRA